jgi:AcrR family transcriptional regulator
VRTPVLTYGVALSAARKTFLKNGNVDMQALADEVAVGRATLYRVVGSRDRLLGDVIWSFGERTLERAKKEVTGVGLEGVVEVARRFNEYVIAFEPLRKFLQYDPVTAFRILFTPAGRVHQRFVEAWEKILREEQTRGSLAFQFSVEDAAYVFVRIGESMLYSDLLADRTPDIALAARAQLAILRPPDPAGPS